MKKIENENVPRRHYPREDGRRETSDHAKLGYRKDGAYLYAKKDFRKMNGEYVDYLIKIKKPSGNLVTVDTAKSEEEMEEKIEEHKDKLEKVVKKNED